MTEHNPISITIDGDQLYANAQLLGVISINGGDNVQLENSGATVNVVQDPSFTSLTVNGDASFAGDLDVYGDLSANTATFDGNVTMNTDLDVFGDLSANTATFDGAVVHNGDVSFGTNDITSVGTITATGIQAKTATFNIHGLNKSGATDYAFQIDSVDNTRINTQTGKDILFMVNDVTKMTIDSNGLVGIGTANPDNPLNVSNNGYVALSVGDANLPTWNAMTTQAKAPTNGTVRIAKNGCWFEGIDDGSGTDDYGFIGRVEGGDVHIVNGNNWDNEILIYTLGNGGTITDDAGGGSSAVIIANYVASSDDRIKHNEVTIVNALSAIRQLRPVTYFIRPPTADVNEYDINHNFDVNTNGFPVDTSGNSVPGYFEHGLIAQEVDMIPDFKYCVVHPKNEDDIYKLKYPSIFTHGIAAIQEVDQQQQADQVKIATLESQVATQTTQIATQNTQIADLLARVTALESV